MNVENLIAPTKLYARPYTAIAQVYDQMMSHVKYRRWAKYIYAILKKENFSSGALLDIGCGTGEFLNQMGRYRYQLSGCDASKDMSNVARRKLPGMPIHIASLPALRDIPENAYDVIVCLYDTVNYVQDEFKLKESFKNISRKLKTPGIFIFDVVTKSYCERFFQNYSENEVVGEQIAYSRESCFDSLRNVQTNYIQIFTPDGIFEEIHKQKIYDLRFILETLYESVMFHRVSIVADFSFRKADENSGRVHFIAKKIIT